MSKTKVFTSMMVMVLSFSVFAQRKEVREVHANDQVMKTINLTLGRSTILSFSDKPVKVVTGNSNYFNVEYIGNDLTIQPLANVDTNLFVYTQSKMKYGFHLKVGSSALYDDMVYVRWKSPYQLRGDSSQREKERPQKAFKVQTIKLGALEMAIHKLTRLRGTKTYIVDFEVKNKGTSEVKLKDLDVFVSRNSERLKGQSLFFKKDNLPMHETSLGRIILPVEKSEDFSFFASYQKKRSRAVISKIYL